MNNSSDLTGKVLGTCTLVQLIGRGGMGAVYLAQQTRPIRRVAVKVLLPNLLTSGDVYIDFLARFQREANLIAQLEHVNIVPIYEYGEQDGLTFLVMPYLTGGSLRDVLTRRGKLSLYEAIAYIDQAAAALDYAHAHGIIHRDLKPANFLLHADGRLVLADFGIARIMQDNSHTAQSTLTGTGMFLGTPEYMAPEMIRGEKIDHRADIYELGIVLFQMLSGTTPYNGNTPLVVFTKHLQEPLPSLHAINLTIPQSVDTVMQQATAKRPEDRFMTAGAFAQSLRLAFNTQKSTLEGDEQNIATMLSSPRPVTPQVITPQVISTNQARNRIEPTSGEFSRNLPAYQVTPPGIQRSSLTSRQPLLLFIGILLVLVLVLGGVLLGLQLNRGGTNPSSGLITTPSVPSGQITNTPNSTSGKTVTTAPTGLIPKGPLLYYTPVPGVSCEKSGGTWSIFNQAKLICQSTYTTIINTNNPSPNMYNLVGTLLKIYPGMPSQFPSNYVEEAQLQQVNSSNADFGLYFRNQPGSQNQGVYTFLIHPDGSWSSYVYDNQGNRNQIAAGVILGSAYSSMKIDVLVKGDNFSFYVDDKLLGNAINSVYSTGTVGIAVDAGGAINASNFALYATQ